MKAALFALALLTTTSAFARQYIQCSILDVTSTDVMVVNLATEEGGTLFLSSGMQNPEDERVLVKIAFDRIEKNKHYFKVIDEAGKGEVAVPSNVIGKSSDSFLVDLSFADYSFEYSCFARIYND